MKQDSPTVLILGVGNTILSDDAVGPLLVRRLRRLMGRRGRGIDFRENHSAGIDLLHEISGYDRVLIVDSLPAGEHAPGSCRFLRHEDIGGGIRRGSVFAHGLDLPALIELGRMLGFPLPDQIRICAVAVSDTRTFGELPTPPVLEAFPRILEELENYIESWLDREPERDEAIEWSGAKR